MKEKFKLVLYALSNKGDKTKKIPLQPKISLRFSKCIIDDGLYFAHTFHVSFLSKAYFSSNHWYDPIIHMKKLNTVKS